MTIVYSNNSIVYSLYLFLHVHVMLRLTDETITQVEFREFRGQRILMMGAGRVSQNSSIPTQPSKRLWAYA